MLISDVRSTGPLVDLIIILENRYYAV